MMRNGLWATPLLRSNAEQARRRAVPALQGETAGRKAAEGVGARVLLLAGLAPTQLFGSIEDAKRRTTAQERRRRAYRSKTQQLTRAVTECPKTPF